MSADKETAQDPPPAETHAETIVPGPAMTRPRAYLARMIVFLALIGAGSVLILDPVQQFFMTNAPLNGLILGVLVIGIFYNFRQVLQLYPDIAWVNQFRHQMQSEGPSPVLSQPTPTPKLLVPMAAMIANHNSLLISTLSMRSLLDGISSRLEESRDLSRYTIGLLIFLGLLGTFWGLLQTVSSIGDVIAGLSFEGGNAVSLFGTLKKGLEAPMAGMGTAFSSSLFGLSGSLVLGFLDLQAGQAQNRFFNNLEEWLSTITRLSSGALSGDGEQAAPAYIQALLEQTAEGLENLQRTLVRSEDTRIQANADIQTLASKIDLLVEQMRTEQMLMKSIAETHVMMKPVLQQIATESRTQGGMDQATADHIRNLDTQVRRMANEFEAGRNDLARQIRDEIKILAKTLSRTLAATKTEFNG